MLIKTKGKVPPAKRFRVADNETARDINRRVVLNIIRTHEPISRADLARYSGMQPSTVSLIVEQLIGQRWVVEGPLGRLPRGRSPRHLRLNVARAGVIGISIRPGTTQIAIADLNGRFLFHEVLKTPATSDALLAELCARTRMLRESHSQLDLEGIGIAAPGVVDLATQRLNYSVNLGWRDVDLKTALERAAGLPVELENAANACALAEYYFGSEARGEGNLAVVTVSEGIGSGILVGGQVLRGSSGLATEFGHVTLDYDGPECGCGNRGCWEMFASNAATIRRYLEPSVGGRSGSRREGLAPTIDDVLDFAQQGDRKAIEALERTAFFIGLGMATIMNTCGPAVFAITGEITRIWSRFVPVVERTLAERSLLKSPPRIIALDEAMQPRLRGAIALVLQKHFALPAGYSYESAPAAFSAVRVEAAN
jgi:predicted NBD/HSP70 family sugar kinase